RIKIYIFDYRSQYQSNTGEPGWSDGSSIQKLRTIYSYAGAQGFIGTALPHEIGHIIFRNLIGFENTGVPRWIEEGVSSLNEAKDHELLRSTIENARSRGALISLHDLSRMDIRAVQDSAAIDLFYIQSYSIVKYLTDTFGWEKFLTVCRALVSAKDIDSVIAQGFGFKDIDALEADWQRNI
ncbi:MAG: peptidase MA family metallohydrolase, partial [Candidatus Omnitrophota bacterium]